MKTTQKSLYNRILHRAKSQKFPGRAKLARPFLWRILKMTYLSRHWWSWCQRQTNWKSHHKRAIWSLRRDVNTKNLTIKTSRQAPSTEGETLANKGSLRLKTMWAGSASPSLVIGLQQVILASWPKTRRKDSNNNRKCKSTKVRKILQDQGMKVVLMPRRWSASWILLSKELKKTSVPLS